MHLTFMIIMNFYWRSVDTLFHGKDNLMSLERHEDVKAKDLQMMTLLDSSTTALDMYANYYIFAFKIHLAQ